MISDKAKILGYLKSSQELSDISAKNFILMNDTNGLIKILDLDKEPGADI